MTIARIACIGALFTLIMSAPVLAQTDLTGEWANKYQEDYWHRQAGPSIGDYTGLPINEAGRLKALTWEEAVMAEPENQCHPHPGTYFMRGPSNIRITRMVDPVSGNTIAYTLVGVYSPPRTLWMDGRSHPADYAKHTWTGFSTAEWDGNKLKVTTTHLKTGWIQRNGVAVSDLATMTEWFIRQDNVLTVASIVTDPVYLEEPFIRTTNWTLDGNLRIGTGVPDCGPDDITPEAKGFSRYHVPHHLPGQNDQIQEFAQSKGIPVEVAMGGAAETYPEYLPTLQRLIAAASVRTAASAGTAVGDPFAGEWVLHRGKSKFGRADTLQVGANGINTSDVMPARRLMKYLIAGNSVTHVIDTQPMLNDTGFNRVEYTAAFDGKDYPIKGSNLETVSVRRVDARTIERVGKTAGQIVETATATVSGDGRELTIATKGTFKGMPYANTQVFERP